MSDHVEPIPKSVPPPPPKRVRTVAPAGKSPYPPLLFVLFAAVLGASVYAERAATPAPTPPAVEVGKPADPADAAKPGDAAKPAAVADPSTTPAPASPSGATAEDVKSLKGEIAALGEKLAAMPKAEAAPDLKPIHEKIDGLAKSVESATDGPKKISDEVAGKLAEAGKADAALKAEIEALRAEIAGLKKDMSAAKPVAATPADESPKPAPGEAAAMTTAIDLFKGGKYADALAAFKKLPADDARVLYFTALANGFSSNNWKGDAEAAVLKGIEREKAGSPAKADIDAAVGALTKAQGKDWLDAYRARVK